MTKIWIFRLEPQNKTESLKRNPVLFLLPIMNVISNAVEYSAKNRKLPFKVQGTKKILQFLIANSGNEFSKEELEVATEQFYRGDKNRNSKNHYGIGLAVIKSFVTLHHGDIELSNSTRMRRHR